MHIFSKSWQLRTRNAPCLASFRAFSINLMALPKLGRKKSHGGTQFPVGRTVPHSREARASGLLWFAPLVCHTSAGWPLSRPSQCAHWLALRSMRKHRPALTADGQRSTFPARGANLLTCVAIHIPRPNLRRDRAFNAAADLLRHVLNLAKCLPPILRFKAVIKCRQI